MSYCRKCGAKLDEDARFCRVCGSPAETPSTVQRAPVRRRLRTPFIIPVAILIAVFLVAFLFAVFAFVPLNSVNFSKSNFAPATPGVDTINLNFHADVADVNVIPTDLPNQLVKIDVFATGSTGLFGSTTEPVKLSFNSETLGNTVTVTSAVSRTEAWPISFNLKVTCNVYLDRNAVLDVDARTSVGKVTLNPEVPVVFQGLSLRSTTGSVETSLSNLVVLTRNVSVSTTTGSVQFTWNNVQTSGNTSVNLATTTGSVTADVTHNKVLAGNVSVDAKTTTGSVNLGMSISGNVGAQITSHTSLGSITTDMQSFNGNKSPIYSNNYPAASNFLVNAQTTTGSIHITAAYQGAAELPTQEQVRDSAMSYIRANHPETAQYMSSLNWTGGRVNTGLLGAEIYTYQSAGWNVNVSYPVIPNPTYTIVAAYSDASVSISWEGTYQNGTVTETSYSETATVSTQEQVRNSVMNFIQVHHNETAQFMQNLNWTGGRVDRGLIVGAELYRYISGGWNVTMTYPVYPNPIYTVTADYSSPSLGIPYRVIWEGTWQNGTITQTSYTFAQ